MRVYFVGHSFHMFVVRPLIALAKEAGIADHWAEGWDMIGGSTPMQHWEKDGDDSEVKQALRAGRVDALTLCSNVVVPEPGIDRFVDLAVAHNPAIRVLVQHSWGDAATSAIMRARHVTGGEVPTDVPPNEARDLATADDLAAMRASNGAVLDRLQAQLDRAVARNGGRPSVAIVPAGEVVLRLRELVLTGDLPGVSRQSELFRDVLGHAAQPVVDAVTYLWLGALYGVDPVGLTRLVDAEDPTSAARQGVLQAVVRDVLEPAPVV